MNELTFNQWMMVGLMAISYFFITVKAGQWLMSLLLKGWDKRRKQDRQQRAVNEFYDAFQLDQLKDGSTMRVATKGNLVIMMYRTEEKA
ncbi:DUF4752 family protein [Leclercia sp.]|uniref:DUF4752 family protein n=1 Tax=Leclercia sp. TaxID=1898428 RepID=UPI0028AF81A0|nr:DUF4752 family protein [Leclercia sp.]